ncbi:MAG: SEC-C metal-binding domain-containing protein [bacterium]|nr:SEC-C metal-binding domain-containing protein [bacterium]
MVKLSDAISDYCSSEYFRFLDPVLKQHAESLLAYWCQKAGDPISFERVDAALEQVARLELPLSIRKAFPDLLKAFLSYLSNTGKFQDAEDWKAYVSAIEGKYQDRFREDGTVRGKTFRKAYRDVGRNDPCPCGSGKKFKKCCKE